MEYFQWILTTLSLSKVLFCSNNGTQYSKQYLINLTKLKITVLQWSFCLQTLKTEETKDVDFSSLYLQENISRGFYMEGGP